MLREQKEKTRRRRDQRNRARSRQADVRSCRARRAASGRRAHCRRDPRESFFDHFATRQRRRVNSTAGPASALRGNNQRCDVLDRYRCTCLSDQSDPSPQLRTSHSRGSARSREQDLKKISLRFFFESRGWVLVRASSLSSHTREPAQRDSELGNTEGMAGRLRDHYL